MKVVVVAGIPSLGRRTRMVKFADEYLGAGYEVEHWAWLRSEDERELVADDEARVGRRILQTGGGYANRRLLLWYAMWVVRVLAQLVRHRPRIVHALGLESALPAAIVSRVWRSVQYVYDDADRFSLCHPLPGHVRRLVASVERWVAANALAHLVPGEGRYPDGLPCRETVVLRNFPSRALVDASRAVVTPGRRSPLSVYVNGWIGDERGGDWIYQTAQVLADSPSVSFIVAGRLTGYSAELLPTCPNVEYLGSLSASESLATYGRSDVVLTFYDPAVPINRWAEANKWGDCLVMGTPFVVNSEVKTASGFINAGAAFGVPYGDVDALTQLLLRLRDEPQMLEDARQALEGMRPAVRFFDEVLRDQILPLLEGAR